MAGRLRRAASTSGLLTPRLFACRCGRPVFFGNSLCVGCGTSLGYEATSGRLIAIEPVPGGDGLWRAFGRRGATQRYRRCSQLEGLGASLCNWLVPEGDGGGLMPARCRCCRLLAYAPLLATPDQALWFTRIEQARRRLVSSLIGLGLPVASRVEDAAWGLAFEIRLALPGQPSVVTGHADGVITLDLREADDSTREQRRHELGEPYRTPLGHLRHESGHYYWRRLLERDAAALNDWRAHFGDERSDYAAALARHYAQGAPPDWRAAHVSAYASAHPWEDWAETWAHYLHMIDTLDSARSFGLDGSNLALQVDPFDATALQALERPAVPVAAFMDWLQQWIRLTGVLNELSRAMGLADFYPFVLSAAVVRKLYFVHAVVASLRPGQS